MNTQSPGGRHRDTNRDRRGDHPGVMNPAHPPSDDPGARPARWRAELRAFGELFALAGLAITQPILDVFGRAPDQFIFRGAERRDIITFALIIALAAPTTAYAAEVLAGLASRTARRIIHLTALGVFATILFTLLLDNLLPRLAANIAALALTAGFLLLHQRTRGLRIWLAFLTPAPIAFTAIFLLASQTAPLLQGPAGALGTPVRKPAPTIVILFDELPLITLLDENGDIDADLFPNFARLAETSHWFRQTTTVANVTAKAAPALLTGNLPADGTIGTSQSHPENLFTLVGGAMPVTSSEAVTRLCPASVCERLDADAGGLRGLLADTRDILHQRLSPTDPEQNPLTGLAEADFAEPAAAEGEGEGQFGGEVSDGGRARFDRMLDTLDPSSRGLHYIHLLVPHSPYRFLPDGTTYTEPHPDIGLSLDRWVDSEPEIRLSRQRFLLQVQWTDTLLGRLLDRLEELGTFDETNIVITSDHGYGFEPGGPMRALDIDNAGDDLSIAEILWIPLFVKAAGQTEGIVSDDPVRSVDVLPTIAELLDVEVPWEHDGRSAYDGGSGDPDEVGMNLAPILERTLDAGPYRALDRDAGFELLMTRNTGDFAPAGDGVTGSDRLYRIGPRPDLYGEPVPDRAREIAFTLHEDVDYDDVDPASGHLPALFRAETGEAEPGQDVAIAVDGTIWATTTVYSAGGAKIAAILPPEVLTEGARTVTVHRID